VAEVTSGRVEFPDNVGDTRRETERELAYLRDRAALLAKMSAGDVVDAPFVYLDRRLVTLALTRIHLFERIQQVPGAIVECGVHRGNSLMLFQHLSSILEPTNINRQIIGFDTFEGFPSVSPHDPDARVGHMRNTDHDHLAEWVQLQDRNRLIGHVPKVELVKGDATHTIPRYVQENPHLIVALLYLDFDIFEPTSIALQHLLPLVPRGGVVGFDELGQKKWSGETVAMRRHLNLNGVRLSRFAYDPHVTYFVVE